MPRMGGLTRIVSSKAPLSRIGVETMDRSEWILYLPILFFLSYLVGTVLLFAFGPWPWPVRNGTKLYIFLTFAHLALLLGYLCGIRSTPTDYGSKWSFGSLIRISLAVNIMLLGPTALVRTGSSIPDLFGGILEPGYAYETTIVRREELFSETLIVEYLRIILAPLSFFLMPLTAYYWQRLKTLSRTLSVVALSGSISLSIAMGVNKGLGDMMIVVPWLIAASYFSGALKMTWTQKVALGTCAVIIFAFFLWFFSMGQLSRTGSGARIGYFAAAGGIFADYDNLVVKYMPSEMKSGIIALVGYLTQGYYGLYLAIEKPFMPTFGVGNSFFLFRNIVKITDYTDLEKMPYPMRIDIEDGWNIYVNWSSIYPWIASDVSFPGTIVVVFIIGYCFSLSWLDTLHGANPFAVVAFAQWLLMLAYFSANNICLQGGESFMAFWATMILWLYTRRKRRPMLMVPSTRRHK